MTNARWGNLNRAATMAMLSGLSLLTACEKQPGGQSLAVVDGEEITQQELRAQADTAGIPPRQDVRTYGPATLQTLIDRNLLANYARDQGLDRGPEYIARRRQLDQALLATLATRRILGTPTQPSDAEIQQYIARNATMFADRQRLALDQIRFPTPARPERIRELSRLGSMDAIAQQLRTEGVAFERSRPVLDTAAITTEVAKQILATPAGQRFDFSASGMTFVSEITGRTPVATPPAGWTKAAGAAVMREKSARTARQAIDRMRAAAKITYDPAFRPEATPTAPPVE